MSREAFEHWYADYTGDAHIRKYCDSTGRYQFNAMQSAWNAWQAALQHSGEPVVDADMPTPPCDCIENVNGRWVQSCECRNVGDLLSAHDWCTYNNLLSAGKETTE